MAQSPILLQYENLAKLTELMLEAARMADWEYFDELQGRYESHVLMMKVRGPYPALTPEEREAKFKFVERMLAVDREMQHIAESMSAH